MVVYFLFPISHDDDLSGTITLIIRLRLLCYVLLLSMMICSSNLCENSIILRAVWATAMVMWMLLQAMRGVSKDAEDRKGADGRNQYFSKTRINRS